MDSRRCDVGENVGNCGGSSVSTMAAAREHRKRRRYARRYLSDSSTKMVAVNNIIAIVLVLSIQAVEGTRHGDVGDRRLHRQTFDAAKVRSDPLLLERERWLRQTAAISRILDQNNGGDDAADQEYYDDVNADDNVGDANKDDGYSTPAPTPPPTQASELSAGPICLSHNVPDPPPSKQPTMIMKNKSRRCVRMNPRPAQSTSSVPSISSASCRAPPMPTIVARES